MVSERLFWLLLLTVGPAVVLLTCVVAEVSSHPDFEGFRRWVSSRILRRP